MVWRARRIHPERSGEREPAIRRRLLSLTVPRLLFGSHSMSRGFREVIFLERIGGALQFGGLRNRGSRPSLGLEARGGPHRRTILAEGDAPISVMLKEDRIGCSGHCPYVASRHTPYIPNRAQILPRSANRVWTRAACIQTVHPQMKAVSPLSRSATAGATSMALSKCLMAAALRSIGSRCQRVVITGHACLRQDRVNPGKGCFRPRLAAISCDKEQINEHCGSGPR
jgi:hypothetical protein